jgi:CRP/FNR family transcriptional regulator, cyclic AMP receptor protein
MLTDRLDYANRRRLDFGGYEVRVRLVRVMLELVDVHGVLTNHGVELGVRISHEELGKLVGAKRDAVSLAMRRLRAEGLITQQVRSVRIADLNALRRVADEDGSSR